MGITCTCIAGISRLRVTYHCMHMLRMLRNLQILASARRGAAEQRHLPASSIHLQLNSSMLPWTDRSCCYVSRHKPCLHMYTLLVSVGAAASAAVEGQHIP
jgi:hypothetical protein